MRALFWLIFLFAVAVSLALFAQFNQSNVVIFYPPYRVDLSLNLFVAVLLGLFTVLYLLLRGLRALSSMPAKAAEFRKRQRMSRASAALREAIESLFAGRFARAERTAREAQSWPDHAETAALIAARAAQRMQETERRDIWLEQVKAPERQQARLVTLAELQIAARDAEGALGTITQLQASGARHIHVQQLALRAHQHQKNWQEVLRLVRVLEKRKALHPVLINRLKQMACENLLHERREDAAALLAFWNSLSMAERGQERIADQAAHLLVTLHRPQAARRIVEEALRQAWHARLVRRYADCAEESALPLIQQVERWLVQRPADGDLHYALGRLCLHQRLWGKAQASLEASLTYASDVAGQARAHLSLALLYEALEKQEEALQHYRESARLGVLA